MQRMPLTKALRPARNAIIPGVHVNTLRNWRNYFIKYGGVIHLRLSEGTSIECRKYESRYDRRSSRGDWTNIHKEALISIVEERPDFYLDEIQEKFVEMTGYWWSQSYLWKRLVGDFKYSIQVTTDRVYQADEEEMQRFLSALTNLALDPNQFVFVDENQKDRNSSRRRGMWSPRGQPPFRVDFFAESHGIVIH